ncbi:MAG TPA: FKBP-type peptidyl-prolyl cis-trans isomerase [Gammaproteobacteria bacterium]|nr:FKBP-type peptidyl-prolyl cis-trans isomerase [Gammaproteobacteria bacterium]
MNKLLTAVAATVLLCACGQSESVDGADETAGGEPAGGAPGEPALTNDDERVLYTLGVVLGDNIGEFRLTEAEFELVAAGMRDAVTGVAPRVEVDLYGPQIQRLADERASVGVDEEKLAAAEFADEIAARPGAERTDSGLVWVPITEGNGEFPTADDTVTVHYHGTLRDGSVFDSSVERGMPATFPLSGVISCWTEGVPKISVGGKAELLCPSDIAYGDEGRPPTIPGGAVLLFEVELLAIE